MNTLRTIVALLVCLGFVCTYGDKLIKTATQSIGSESDCEAKVISLEKSLEDVQNGASQATQKFRSEISRLEESLKMVSSKLAQANTDLNQAASNSEATLKSVEKVTIKLREDMTILEAELKEVKQERDAAKKLYEDVQELLNTSNKDLLDEKSIYSTFKKTCESNVQKLKEKKATLEEKLANSNAQVNITALASAIYDQAIELASKSYEDSETYLNEVAAPKVKELYATNIAPLTRQASDVLEFANQAATKLYNQHAAATIDPLFEAAHPHIKKITPVVHQNYNHAVMLANTYYQRIKTSIVSTRKQAVARLQTYPSVAKYAVKFVDFVTLIVAFPLAFTALRLSVYIVLSLVSIALYFLTCFGCCGLFGRKSSRTVENSPKVKKTKKAAAAAKAALADRAARAAAANPVPASKKKN